MEKTFNISTKSFEEVKVTMYNNEDNIPCADVTVNGNFIGTATDTLPYPTDPDLLVMYKESLEEWICKHN